jgi:hypothetical protein
MGNGTEEQSALSPGEVELPPMMEALIRDLKSDRKKLLKDKAFKDPEQLRGFIGQYLFPRLITVVEMLGGAMFDTYGLAVSNANQAQRMHAFMVDELRKLGSDVDRDDALPGLSSEALDRFQQAFYALGSVLQKKLPEDKDTEEAWNRCAHILADMVEELMGVRPESEYDDDDDGRRDDADEEPPKAEAKPNGAGTAPEPEPEPAAEPEVAVEAPATDGGDA